MDCVVPDEDGNRWKPEVYIEMDPWPVLRGRWEDQLRILNPTLLKVLESELTPAEEAYAYMAELARSRQSKLRQSEDAYDSLRRDLSDELVKTHAGRMKEQDLRIQVLTDAKHSLLTDSRVLADAVKDLASKLLDTDPAAAASWRDLLTEEVAELVETSTPPAPPTPETEPIA